LGKPLIEHSPEKWDRKDSDKTSTIVGFIVLTGIGILDSATRSSTLVFFPFIFIERGMGESEVGVALFLLFAGGAAGKYICGWLDDRTGTLPLIWATKGMTTALIISAIFVPSFVLWPLAIILGVGLNGTSSVLYATVAKFIPTNKRARYYGLFYTTNEIGTVGAPLGYGLIADMIGLNRSVITMGVVTATILPASLALKRYLTVS
jgi:MFS family permease